MTTRPRKGFTFPLSRHINLNCHWCSRKLTKPVSSGRLAPSARTIDHVKSKYECVSAEEYNHPDNKVWACNQCNETRNDEWLWRNVGPGWEARLRPKWLKPLKSPPPQLPTLTKTGEVSNRYIKGTKKWVNLAICS